MTNTGFYPDTPFYDDSEERKSRYFKHFTEDTAVMGTWMRGAMAGILLLACLARADARSPSPPLVLSTPVERVQLTPYLEVLKDPSGKLTIDEIAGPGNREGFLPLYGSSGFGYSSAVFWFRLAIANPADAPIPLHIEYPYPVADHFEFFHPSPAGFVSEKSGDLYPFGLRPVNFRTFVFPVEIPPGTHTFYFNIRSSGAILSPLTAWSPEAFERHRQLDAAVNWMFYGVMCATFAYCLFTFLAMKEQVFVWMGIFVLGVSLFTLAHTGIGFQFLWPNRPGWANISHPAGGFIGLIGALQFSKHFLNTLSNAPGFNRLFSWLTCFTAGMLMLIVLLPYPVVTQTMIVAVAISVLAMICCGCLMLYRGLRQARFYLLAWSPFALSALVMGLKSYGFLETNLFTDSTVQFTASFVTVLFSFGLVDKVNTLRLEREKALRHLKRSERKYRMLANKVKDVIWTLDLKSYRITYITPSIKEMMGYTPLEAKTTFTFEGMLPPDSARKARRAIQWRKEKDGALVMDHPRGFTIELAIFCKDRKKIWTETTTTFLKDDSGQFTEMIGVTRDITARKQAEQEKKALEFQLHQAGKLEAMGTLAGGIAHDMNNILSAVLGYTELCLYDARDGSRMQSRLQRVVNASQRAKDLVRQILMFSRQQGPDARAVKISLIVKEILALIRASLPSTIDIVRNIKDRELVVMADPSQVHQIVMNLCSNAGYAMMEKGGTLTVSVEKTDLGAKGTSAFPDLSPGAYVSLMVSDTGPGMSDEVLKRIFDPFYTTKPVGEGTGMGLSMVHGIVKNLNGGIRVESAPGRGSRFHVILPMAGHPTRELPAAAAPKKAAAGERILYVDDEPDIVEMAREMLESLGYVVTCCTDSTQALSLFRSDPDRFDLLITDQTMPKMTGTELIRAVRERRPGFPVILSTGVTGRISGAGSHDFDHLPLLSKPYNFDTLSLTVRKVLDGQAVSQQRGYRPLNQP